MSTQCQINVHQGVLEKQLHKIFPIHNIIANARKEASVVNPLTGGYLEVDVWLPELSLSFEYQDFYHYKPTWYSQIPLHLVQQKDYIKRTTLLTMYQTLIIIPYWWNGSTSCLQGTICFYRPDLMLPANQEISANPPLSLVKVHEHLMVASLPASNIMSLNSWWVGEKWDGIRCFWNATEQHVYSRYNFKIDILVDASRARLFGQSVLDGELWCGRSSFQESQEFIARSWGDLNGSFLRMVCFDEASWCKRDQPFEARYTSILLVVSDDHPMVIIAPRFLCTSEMGLMDALSHVIQGGGEGVMLRKPHSQYLPGQSRALFKLKASHSDHEALVVNVNDDGSVLLQLPNGLTYTVPKESCVLHQKLRRGDIVTVSYPQSQAGGEFSNEYSLLQLRQDAMLESKTGLVVHRIRTDIEWSDVAKSDGPGSGPSSGTNSELSFMLANGSYLLPNGTQAIRPNHVRNNTNTDARESFESKEYIANWKLPSERRAYFDKFAITKGMDSLNPVFWYSVAPHELMKYHNGYKGVVWHSGGTLSAALMQLYPDIGLQKKRFKVSSSRQSRKLESERRAFFDAFAASQAMDPLNPLFWYNITSQQLKSYKGYYHISNHYGGKLPSALAQVYPEIGLQERLFRVQSWEVESARRAYFDQFAATKGMDSLNPVFWYRTTTHELIKYHKGYFSIAWYYGGKLSSTLMQIYPDIGLQKKYFKDVVVVNKQSRKLENDRREFFDNFAASKGEDPLNPSFWYKVRTHELKGYHTIARYHGGKLSTTLLQLYPGIGLQQNLFRGAFQRGAAA